MFDRGKWENTCSNTGPTLKHKSLFIRGPVLPMNYMTPIDLPIYIVSALSRGWSAGRGVAECQLWIKRCQRMQVKWDIPPLSSMMRLLSVFDEMERGWMMWSSTMACFHDLQAMWSDCEIDVSSCGSSVSCWPCWLELSSLTCKDKCQHAEMLIQMTEAQLTCHSIRIRWYHLCLRGCGRLVYTHNIIVRHEGEHIYIWTLTWRITHLGNHGNGRWWRTCLVIGRCLRLNVEILVILTGGCMDGYLRLRQVVAIRCRRCVVHFARHRSRFGCRTRLNVESSWNIGNRRLQTRSRCVLNGRRDISFVRDLDLFCLPFVPWVLEFHFHVVFWILIIIVVSL